MLKHIYGTSQSSISEFDIKQIQPNAVDLRLDRVWLVHSRFKLSDDEKQPADKVEYTANNEGWFLLAKGCYEFQFKGIVKIGDGEAGWIIPRSTLVRNGIFLQSGLYDTGYHGSIGAGAIVMTSSFQVQRGTRLGQLLISTAESVHKYDGSYGIGKSAEQQYS